LHINAARAVFPNASDEELASLKQMGLRWKQYVKEGKLSYQQHAFWISGFTFWSLKDEGESRRAS
jgi:hypothetical protein